MDTLPLSDMTLDNERLPAAEPNQRRSALEAAMIAEADADIEAGRVMAWINGIGTDHELPAPYPRP